MKLCQASYRGDSAEVSRLLMEGVPVNSKGRNGFTALHEACLQNRSDIVEILLNYMPDINQTDDEGNTPLHLACKNGCLDCVKTMIVNGQCDLGKY